MLSYSRVYRPPRITTPYGLGSHYMLSQFFSRRAAEFQRVYFRTVQRKTGASSARVNFQRTWSIKFLPALRRQLARVGRKKIRSHFPAKFRSFCEAIPPRWSKRRKKREKHVVYLRRRKCLLTRAWYFWRERLREDKRGEETRSGNAIRSNRVVRWKFATRCDRFSLYA